MPLLRSLMLMATCLCAAPAFSMERVMRWEGTPLPLTMTPGQELIVNFGDDVRIAMPAHLKSVLSTASLGGRVYLSANADFNVTRLHVERLSDGMRVLLDVQAGTALSTLPQVDVVLPKHIGAPVSDTAATVSQSQALKMAPQALLIRYAMQNLYSPTHAIEPLSGVVRMPMGLTNNIQASAFPYWAVEATPIAAWKLGNDVVTAIEVRNLSNSTQSLDPRQVALGGACLMRSCMVSFVYPEIGAVDGESASSTAFIVTPGPLRQHLLPVEASRG
ncbi:TIGR03749 family integrating conjugative element protein [Aliivibrio fischeri]|uniref:Integrating conjugative element protein n=1 Tax=Aliivibrio fischeri TaxID=668 RepID=A0A510UPL5_ALIFS|nr:TIGR03749 family integrating conjugative element protein [Aliivibrio fischeri]GEK15391.1 integrating conjugative element protein [Aliivibrio fischeri]